MPTLYKYPTAHYTRGPITLQILRMASRERENYLPERMASLREKGFNVRFVETPEDPSWLYTAGRAEDRARLLTEALMDDGVHAIISARGGYGVSDMLPFIDWNALRKVKPKLVVGFSDVGALHTAMLKELGWMSVHGPMPATSLWDLNPSSPHPDLDMLFGLLRGDVSTGSIAVESASTMKRPLIKGWLYGGCLSVVSAMIGTPQMPNLDQAIVFFEDTTEHPARLLRYFNQFLQSGVLNKAHAIVLGQFRAMGPNIPDNADFVYEEFARRSPLPVYRSAAFGHCAPNYPLVIGAAAEIAGSTLTWTVQGPQNVDQTLS